MIVSLDINIDFSFLPFDQGSLVQSILKWEIRQFIIGDETLRAELPSLGGEWVEDDVETCAVQIVKRNVHLDLWHLVWYFGRPEDISSRHFDSEVVQVGVESACPSESRKRPFSWALSWFFSIADPFLHFLDYTLMFFQIWLGRSCGIVFKGNHITVRSNGLLNSISNLHIF